MELWKLVITSSFRSLRQLNAFKTTVVVVSLLWYQKTPHHCETTNLLFEIVTPKHDLFDRRWSDLLHPLRGSEGLFIRLLYHHITRVELYYNRLTIRLTRIIQCGFSYTNLRSTVETKIMASISVAYNMAKDILRLMRGTLIVIHSPPRA